MAEVHVVLGVREMMAMNLASLYPLDGEVELLTRHAKLPLHVGKARILSQDRMESKNATAMLARIICEKGNLPKLAEASFDASLVVPATGDVLIFLRGGNGARLNRDFGTDLILDGDGPEGSFQVHCPRFSIRRAHYSRDLGEIWGIATPIKALPQLHTATRVRSLVSLR